MACPKCGQRLRTSSPAPSQADAPAPLVDVARFRRTTAGPSRLPLALGVGGAVLLAAAVAAYFLWGQGPANPTPAVPPREPVVQAPTEKNKAENADPSGSHSPHNKPTETKPPPPPPQPPPADPAPPKDPGPPVPEVPEAWQETTLADLPPGLEAQVVDKVNAARKTAGLPPVALDADASKGCAAHAAYLARNAGRIAALRLNVHAEEASLPGRSEIGVKAAPAAMIAAKEPLSALDDWTAAPAHSGADAAPEMEDNRGRLRAQQQGPVGVGLPLARRDDGRPVRGGEGRRLPRRRSDGRAAVFPRPRTARPPPGRKGKVPGGGVPDHRHVPAGGAGQGAEAHLEDESGKAIDAWFSSPEKPANDRAADLQKNTICLIAKAPLDPGVRYAVSVQAKVDQRDWQAAWSFLTTGPEDLRRDFEDRFLARINAAREGGGLPPTTLDPVDSVACAAHARYVSLNFPAHPDMNRQDETPDWPGFSEEGRKAAKNCVSLIRIGSPEQCVDLLMSSLGARTLFLEPKVTRIGLGSSWIGAAAGSWVLTVPPFGEWTEVHPVLLYPIPDQKGVPTLYGAEAPSAVPEEAKGKPAGLPATVRFPWHKPLDKVTGRLTDASGQEVAIWLSTPQKPLTGVPLFLVTLLPREPLREGETYTATVTADFSGEDWKKTWSFTTRKRDDVDAAALQAKVLERVNEVRRQAGLKGVEMDAALSRGCQAHARYLVANDGRPALEKLGAQNEDRTAPGATAEGAKAGKASILLTVGDPSDAVEGWMRTFFHRLPILAPELQKIGFGCAQYPNEAWSCVMDVQSGK